MKEEIITILGKNKTTPAVFDNWKNIKAQAIYTYKGDVYCLKDGLDFPLEELSEKDQLKILNELKAKAFKFDNSFQG